VDPAVAGGGVLTDHGWHVFYVLPAWVGARPTSVGARLEKRRHTAFAVEDTASVRLGFADASAEIFLTWAAEERLNRVEVDGTEGRIELRDDTLVLTSKGGERRWPGLPALSDGSHHPDWFHKVADRFLAAVAEESRAGANLAEAALCCEIEHLARESSRRGGVQLPLDPATVVGSRLWGSRL
jgi:predicted dehydrogenase